MKKLNGRSMLVVAGLLAFGPLANAQPQYATQRDSRYDPHYAQPRDLVALQDDLQVLDDDLSAVPRRNPRYQEFQRRADDIRLDVTTLADQMRRHRDGRHEGPVGGPNEVAALRERVAVLRDDIENSQVNRRGRGNDSFVVPAGTDIQLMLDQDLSSRSSNLEDRVEASTVSAIQMNGRTVLPAGAAVSGVVREVRSKSRGQKDGWIRLEFDTLALPGGTHTNIRSHVVSVSATRSDNHKVRNGGLGALLGGVIGGIIDGKKGALIGAAVGAGGGLLASRGQDVDLPAGSLLTIRLDSPLSLVRR